MMQRSILKNYHPRNYAEMKSGEIEKWFNIAWKIICVELRQSSIEDLRNYMHEKLSFYKHMMELKAIYDEVRANRSELYWISACIQKIPELIDWFYSNDLN